MCRVCSLVEGKAVSHDSECLHKDAPAVPISTIVTKGLAYFAQKKVRRGQG